MRFERPPMDAKPVTQAAWSILEDFGYPVVACGADKRPIHTGWPTLIYRNQSTIEEAFAPARAQLVGVLTGSASGLFLLDIDPDGRDWFADNFARLEAKRLHTTRRASGRHIWYQIPEGWTIKTSASQLAPGIDTRGEGGQGIWWPAHGGTAIHDENPGLPPQWLLEALEAAGVAHRSKPNGHAKVPPEAPVRTQAGNRNDTLTRLAGSMRKAGLSTEAIGQALHTENRERFNPPLPDQEIEALLGQVEKWERGEVAPSLPELALLWFATLDVSVHQEAIVKGLLLAASLVVIYGESNSGKTFLALDLALAIAAGIPWRGRRTRAGLVIYVAGEGAASVRSRVAAYRKSNPQTPADLPFAILPQAVDFLSQESISALILAIQAAQSKCGLAPVFIVIDTYARALVGGDENSTQDTGKAVSGADRIRIETGACVGFVHHAGKDPSKGARGSSALRAATDTEILVEGVIGPRTATVSKQRDLESGQIMAFELTAVQIGTDPEDGSSITSCVVKHLETQVVEGSPVMQLRGKAQRQFVAAMRERSKEEPQRIWSLADLRRVGAEIGLVKSTARSVVDAIANSPYMQPTSFGYRFTDGLKVETG